MNQKHAKESLLEESPAERPKEGVIGRMPWLRASFFLLVVFFVSLPFTPIPEKLKDYAKELIVARRQASKAQAEKPRQEPVVDKVATGEKGAEPVIADPNPVEKIPSDTVKVIVPDKVVRTPVVHEIGTRGDMKRMSKGFTFDFELDAQNGGLASDERIDNKSYVAEYKLKVKLPKASQSIEQLSGVNSEIDHILPDLDKMLERSEVSDFYYQLYKNKMARLQRDALKLNELSTKHNFFDCETILNLKHAESGRRVLLMQADMDVVSDGSDGDRLAVMPDAIVNSTHYQPFTSYGWVKTSRTVNPMLAGWKKRIGNAKREIAERSTKADRRNWLESRLKMLERGVADMKSRSFLIAEYDPFIVMPVNMLKNRTDKYAARVGDYAVVIYGGKVYPAIVGDGGPTFKVGEASLRMAKQLNERSSPYSRPVSDLSVTYLVFSNSREKRAKAPDYKYWHEKCSELLAEIGGLGEGYELHQWEDLLATPEEEAEEASEGNEQVDGDEVTVPPVSDEPSGQ